MNFSAPTRYALRLLFELREPGRVVASAQLAERTGIALKTVEKVQAVLKERGITSGAVGPRGGIALAVPLSEVSLGQVVELFDGGVVFGVCLGEKANACPNQRGCTLSDVWSGISRQVRGYLDGIDLESLFRQIEPGCRGLPSFRHSLQ